MQGAVLDSEQLDCFVDVAVEILNLNLMERKAYEVIKFVYFRKILLVNIHLLERLKVQAAEVALDGFLRGLRRRNLVAAALLAILKCFAHLIFADYLTI